MRSIALTLAAAACALSAQATAAEVSYRLHYERTGDSSVSIEIAWPDPLDRPSSLVFPAPFPWEYGEQRYDAFVSSVQAFATDGRDSTPERRGFKIDELAGLIDQATGVDTRAIIEKWLQPLE